MYYTIDEDLPVPGRAKYPFAEMKPGHSFLIPNDEIDDVRKVQRRVISSANQAGVKILTRTVNNDEHGHGLRVWLLSRNGKPARKKTTKKRSK